MASLQTLATGSALGHSSTDYGKQAIRTDARNQQPLKPSRPFPERARNLHKRVRPSPNPKNAVLRDFGIADIHPMFFSTKV